MLSKTLQSLAPALASFLFLAATQEPQNPPPPVRVPTSCQGCLAKLDSYLPAIVHVEDGVGLGIEIDFDITWTRLYEIKNHGLCGDLDGSCLKVEDCLVLMTAIGTCDHDEAGYWLPSQPWMVSAGVDTCGGEDKGTVYIGGDEDATIDAECSACAVQ